MVNPVPEPPVPASARFAVDERGYELGRARQRPRLWCRKEWRHGRRRGTWWRPRRFLPRRLRQRCHASPLRVLSRAAIHRPSARGRAARKSHAARSGWHGRPRLASSDRPRSRLGLDERARESVRAWKFIPAHDAARRALASWVTIEVVFRLI